MRQRKSMLRCNTSPSARAAPASAACCWPRSSPPAYARSGASVHCYANMHTRLWKGIRFAVQREPVYASAKVATCLIPDSAHELLEWRCIKLEGLKAVLQGRKRRHRAHVAPLLQAHVRASTSLRCVSKGPGKCSMQTAVASGSDCGATPETCNIYATLAFLAAGAAAGAAAALALDCCCLLPACCLLAAGCCFALSCRCSLNRRSFSSSTRFSRRSSWLRTYLLNTLDAVASTNEEPLLAAACATVCR